jgi:hypothetical protein
MGIVLQFQAIITTVLTGIQVSFDVFKNSGQMHTTVLCCNDLFTWRNMTKITMSMFNRDLRLTNKFNSAGVCLSQGKKGIIWHTYMVQKQTSTGGRIPFQQHNHTH